jgi:RNA polymerase sigma-70 factor, ECF subfamily
MFNLENSKKAYRGDFKSIEEICSSTWEPLYRYIYYKVQNREEAEDITQETYVKTLSYLQKNSINSDKYIGFLKTVSLNIIRDRWRRGKRQGTSVNIETINPEETAVEDPTEESAQRSLVEDALGKLTEEQSKVVRLRIIEGYSAAETAIIMNKKEVTVRVIQYRALKALSSILEEND